MNNNLFISDQFEAWKKCKKKYYYKYIKKLRMPEVQVNYELGKSVHALADYYIRGLNIDHLENNLDNDLKIHWESIKKHRLMSLKSVFSEWAFNALVPNSNCWLNGRIDAIFYDSKISKYIIVDWKTGQNVPKNPHDGFQSKVYLYSFYVARNDLKLNIKPDDILFQYVKTPECEEIEPVYFSQDKYEEYGNEFKVMLDEINSADCFPKCSESKSKNCKYCPYLNICFKNNA